MQHLIINFSICLFSLWLVYKLLLENTSWHQFKRYYFLAAMLISAVIPFIVVRTVVIPFASGGTIDFTTMEAATSEVIETGFTLDWNLILLGIYCIGVIIMAARFIKNLYDLRIKTSDEVSSYENYKLVLRELIQIPHSFFGRIYAFKTDYQSGTIPDTVLQHEKAHLDQKHSIDILFIELFIVLMWFNPLLYLIKYSIKLNHEFLADKAVLANGVDTKTYQETLLAYSSSSQHQALVNTFNFPIIKKRFTIMKIHTSKTSLWLRTIAVLPVLAVLIISCGQEEVVVEPEIEVIEIVEDEDAKVPDRKLILIPSEQTEGTTTLFNGDKYFYHYQSDGFIQFFDSESQEWDFKKEGYRVEIIEITEDIIEVLEELSQDDINNYNRLAKKHAALIEEKGHTIYFKNETSRMQTIWNSMSEEQRANAEQWPYLGLDGNKAGEIAPPPPPASEPLRGNPISSNRKMFYKTDYGSIYDGEVNFYSEKELSKLKKQLKNNILVVSGITIYKGNNYYFASNDSEKVFINELNEIVDLDKRIGKKLEVKPFLQIPPPPPPAPKEKSLKKALHSSVNTVENEASDLLYAINTYQIRDSTHATKQMMAEYKKLIQDSYKGNDRVWKNSDLEKMTKIYAQMSPSQKSSVEKLPAMLSYEINEVKPIQPSKSQFEALKNKSEFAVWIDGKVIDNNVLEQYSREDFAHFNMSKVYKNARSERFPQPFQVSLFTKVGFEQTFRNKVDVK